MIIIPSLLAFFFFGNVSSRITDDGALSISVQPCPNCKLILKSPLVSVIDYAREICLTMRYMLTRKSNNATQAKSEYQSSILSIDGNVRSTMTNTWFVYTRPDVLKARATVRNNLYSTHKLRTTYSIKSCRDKYGELYLFSVQFIWK